MIYFNKFDEVWCKLQAEQSELKTLADRMTFEVAGSKFSPMVQQGLWDGKIRLINLRTNLMYGGLIPAASSIAAESGYETVVDEEYNEYPFSEVEAQRFVKSLKLPFAPHDYQMHAFIRGVQTRRMLFLSPVNSGKSLIIYLLIMYFKQKALIVVPTIGLIGQMQRDFKNYGYQDEIGGIMGGTAKEHNTLITVSTWNSIYELPPKYFRQYQGIYGDEVHRFVSKSLKLMMEKTTATPIKIGLTGTLDGSKTHELVLQGLFGTIHKTTTTRDLIDRGISSNVSIKTFILSYTKEQLKMLPPKSTYPEQTNFILANHYRNLFIKNLVESLKGNTIILFRRVEDHGDLLIDLLKQGSKQVHYIHGKTKLEERLAIQNHLETVDNDVLTASDGTFATGVSINNIQNIIRVNPIKSEITNIQGMGRGLRLDRKQNRMNYFDLGDDLGIKPIQKNYLYMHAMERMKIYVREELPFKTYKITLGD